MEGDGCVFELFGFNGEGDFFLVSQLLCFVPCFYLGLKISLGAVCFLL